MTFSTVMLSVIKDRINHTLEFPENFPKIPKFLNSKMPNWKVKNVAFTIKIINFGLFSLKIDNFSRKWPIFGENEYFECVISWCSISNVLIFLFQVTERTPIKLNSPVYVSLDLDRPFKWNNIVLSLRSCFATDNPRSAFPTDNYYSLITGM